MAAQPAGSQRYRRAAEIATAHDGLAAELERKNAAGAAWWALRLGQHLAQADQRIARADGGSIKAELDRERINTETAACEEDYRRLQPMTKTRAIRKIAAQRSMSEATVKRRLKNIK
jgi:hypothetical protein